MFFLQFSIVVCVWLWAVFGFALVGSRVGPGERRGLRPSVVVFWPRDVDLLKSCDLGGFFFSFRLSFAFGCGRCLDLRW